MTSQYRSTIIGLDLSSTSAPRGFASDDSTDAQAFIMGRLAGLATLADKGGVDLLALDSSFRLGGRRRDDWLDGAVAAARLGRHTSRATIAAAVPANGDIASVADAIGTIHKATVGRAAWQIDQHAPRLSTRGIDAITSHVSSGRKVENAPQVVIAVDSAVDLELAAGRADIARVRPASLAQAIEIRSAIRQAARDWGRDADAVKVVVDLTAVIGSDDEGAQARADLLSALDPSAEPTTLTFVGTATGLADLWQEWVDAGAADGFTIIPTSVPTDVLAVVTEVLPELERRGLRNTVPPVPETADTPARAGARARARRQQPVAA
ncbi:MAG: hypothetical protein ACK5KU_09705 [Beutenbergiaceae bacterium]